MKKHTVRLRDRISYFLLTGKGLEDLLKQPRGLTDKGKLILVSS